MRQHLLVDRDLAFAFHALLSPRDVILKHLTLTISYHRLLDAIAFGAERRHVRVVALNEPDDHPLVVNSDRGLRKLALFEVIDRLIEHFADTGFTKRRLAPVSFFKTSVETLTLAKRLDIAWSSDSGDQVLSLLLELLLRALLLQCFSNLRFHFVEFGNSRFLFIDQHR